jgi:recombination protein RecT
MAQELSRTDSIRNGLLQSQRQIQSLFADKDKAAQFMAGALVVANSKALSQCTPESIVQSLVGIALSDLNIDPNIGHCYLVPYWSPSGSTAQLQIGYKGFIQLLFRSGWMAKAIPVYQCDKFSMSFNGWDTNISFEQNIDERDEGDNDWVYSNIRGVYVVARHADTKDEYNLFVSKAVIEKLRLNSSNQKANKNTKPEDRKRLDAGFPIGIWADWYVEMAQAKALKKLAKILPIGDRRVQTSIAVDDQIDAGKTVNYLDVAETGIISEVSTKKTKREQIEKELEDEPIEVEAEEIWE